MSGREKYKPGPAAGAEVRKDGDKWTLILVRELRHPPAKDRGFISWGATGWHIGLDVFEQLLAGRQIGRIVGGDALKFEWQRLVTEFGQQFGVAAPGWPPKGG